MLVWRLCKIEHADLSGRGAFLYGGRWNSPGHHVVYASSSLALSCLEIIAGLASRPFPDGFVSLKIEIPDEIIFSIIDQDEFPDNWRKSEHSAWFLEKGNHWLKLRETVVLSVPSVIIPTERNFLINPAHESSKVIKILERKPFHMDNRLHH